MDLFNLPKIIEQGVYDVMMWIVFFPKTLLRMILNPRGTLAYVRAQEGQDPETAFSDGMRPALFLLIAIIIGTAATPDSAEDMELLTGSQLGALLFQSWSSTLATNMIIYCILPIIGAIFLNRARHGTLSRDSMRIPFDQQCYIGAPSTMLLALAQGYSDFLGGPITGILLAGGAVWLIYAEWIFFRDNSTISAGRALLLAIATLVTGALAILALLIAFMLTSVDLTKIAA